MQLILALFLILISSNSFAETYWVSPTGTAPWASCQSTTDPGANYCSLNTANTSAVAGDIVYLKGGTYSVLYGLGVISPKNSGASGNVISFIAAPDETPIIAPTSYWGIYLDGKDYIKISGMSIVGAHSFFRIGNGSDYNEIENCIFSDSPSYGIYSVGLITQTNSAGLGCNGSTNNWIHNNIFTKYGTVSSCVDDGTVRIAADPTVECGEDESYYNTFENNVFSYGGHDAFDLGGRYNVIKNNIMHNEEAYFNDSTGNCENSPASGYFGNRNLIISGYTNTDTNLIEGNRFGHAGAPPDDDGANGIENAGDKIIIRYNYVYGNGTAGIFFKNQFIQRPDDCRIYGNTIYANGYGDSDISSGFKYGIFFYIWDFVNVLHNSITYRCIQAHWTADDKEPGVSAGWENYWAIGAYPGARTLSWTTYKGQYYDVELRPKNNIFKNNIVYGNRNEHSVYTTNGINTYTNNLNIDPSFINSDISDKTSITLPNLALNLGSNAINGGTHLTTVHTDDIGYGVELKVDDSRYFQDASWGSNLARVAGTMRSDWIAVGTVSNVVQISSIDYSTNTITLANSVIRNDGDPIWLYKKSDGEIVLHGSAPDYGAYEYQQIYKNHGSPKSMMSRPPN